MDRGKRRGALWFSLALGVGLVLAFFAVGVRHDTMVPGPPIDLASPGTAASPIQAVTIETEHLKLTAFPSSSTITVGDRFSIAVQVEPNPNMHLYAPGAEELGYKVISLDLSPVSHVRFEPVEFPDSEIYFFEPLDERVPTYQHPFTLLQEAVVSATPEAEEALAEIDALTLSGTFNYQACDDRLCYEPVSVPLSFTLDVELLDRQRAGS